MKNGIKIASIEYDCIGEFINRPNRYLAEVKINGKIEEVHVHDPGRLKELLYEKNTVFVKKALNKNRKTAWDMVAAKAENEMIIVNSAYHRIISENIVRDVEINPLGKIDAIKPEAKYGNSRIDFYGEKDNKKVWIEVKGCTLVKDRIAMFPDAPTERGARHLEELTKIAESGDLAAIYILVLRDANLFMPNFETDEKFCENFYKAIDAGVKVFPIKLSYENKEIIYKGLIPVYKK